MKKGCLIIICALVALVAIGVAAIWMMADAHEKRPKQPGEAEVAAAEEFIISYDGQEASGNTPEAAKFAEDFARDLRVSRGVLYTEGKAGAASLTKGHFMTYCFVSNDSLALLVHVPELRRFSEDAKVSLSEFAWMLASQETRSRFPQVKRLAVGLKGVLNYSSIFTGVVSGDDPIKGIQERHSTVSTEPLWPFFHTSSSVSDNAEQGAAANP